MSRQTIAPTCNAAVPIAGIAYRPDIDGLRAVAVLAVLLFHLGIGPVSGGFVGVDVFFVISGYLIMLLLMSDLRQGRLSVARFYERRIRRIVPALAVMALFCLAAAAVLFPPADFAGFGKSLLAMTLFASNILFCFDNPPVEGYFAAPSEELLLLHTWSLAVEEQFYILLPLGLVIMRRLGDRAKLAIVGAVALLSFAFSVWAVGHWPLGAFYLVTSRAFELLLGSLLALGAVPLVRRRTAREAIAALGLCLVLVAVFGFSRQTPFPGAAALVPCLGACCLIHAGAAAPTMVGRALASRIPVAIGLISYSLYLWHWPIIVLFKHLDVGALDLAGKIAALLLSFVAALISTRYVEQPFRRSRAGGTRVQLFAGAGVVGLALVSPAAVAMATGGLPQRFSPQARAVIAANVAAQTDYGTDECSNYQTEVRQLSDITFCRIGAGASHNILFWGDSLVDTLRPLLGQLHAEGALGGRGAVFATADGCTPAPHLNQPIAGYHCGDFSRLALERAEADDIDTVFIAFSAWWDAINGRQCLASDPACERPLVRHEIEDVFLGDLRESVAALQRRGKKVVISLPAPTYNMPIPQIEINEVTLGGAYRGLRKAGLLRPLVRNDHPNLRARIAEVATDLGAVVYDPKRSLCPDGPCIYERGHVSIYSDMLHVNLADMGIFHDNLRDALQAAR